MDVMRQFLDEVVADDPVAGSNLGMATGAGRLPSWSAEAVAGRLALYRRWQDTFRRLLGSDDRDEAVDAFTGLQIARRQLRDLELRRVHRRRPGTYLDPVLGLFPLVTRELGTPDERVEAMRDRLRGVPGLLEEGRSNLEPDLARAAVRSALDAADGLLELAGPTVLGFAAAAGREGVLDDASRDACAAIDGFRGYLRKALAAAGDACGAGREVIEDVLRYEHVLDDSPEELAAYGRRVIAESREAQAALAGELGYGDVGEAVGALQTQTPTAEGLVAAYERAVAAARRFVTDNDLVGLPAGEELAVEPTPTFLRALWPYAAYDMPGPFLDSRRGVYYVTPPADDLTGEELRAALRNHPSASLPTTGVHEGYPGHHVQLVSANDAPRLVRRVGHLFNGGNILVEGWAFYCEELMERAGFLAEPAVRLLRLNDQIFRACRVVIDVELHLGVMSFEEAVDYLAGETRSNRREAELECLRYAEQPGQAMSYLLGKREILRLAALYRERNGVAGRRFHDELLSWGSLPPAVIAWGMGLAGAPAAARPAPAAPTP